MKQVLYLTMSSIDEASGVYKKIVSQAKAFAKIGFDCKILFVRDNDDAYLMESFESINKINLRDKDVQERIKKYILKSDFCYVRFELLRHLHFTSFIIKCLIANCPIVMEIPTYPPYQESIARVKDSWKSHQYLKSLKTLIGSIFVISDMYILSFISKLVVVIGDNKRFLFTETIRIENGIDTTSNPFFKKTNQAVLKIIAVSNFSVWNGYDRAIIGIKNYVDATRRHDIKLIMVGDVKAGRDLVKLSNDLGVSEDVEFTGSLFGEKLDNAYKESSMALGALGNHRRKVFANSSLKVKEYCSRGMLMVLSDAEGIESEILDLSYVVKSDDSPIDFIKIKDWYNYLDSKEDKRQFIHSFAVNNYSWEYQMTKVVNKFQRKSYGK